MTNIVSFIITDGGEITNVHHADNVVKKRVKSIKRLPGTDTVHLKKFQQKPFGTVYGRPHWASICSNSEM